MRSDEDTAEQSYQDMFGRAQSLSFEAAERSSFIVPEILEMDPSLLASYMESENGIGLYRRLINRGGGAADGKSDLMGLVETHNPIRTMKGEFKR